MKIRLSQLRKIIREVVESEMEEAKKADLNDDGKNDFKDVMIARMKASGEPHKAAVKKGEKAAQKAMRKESVRRPYRLVLEDARSFASLALDVLDADPSAFMDELESGAPYEDAKAFISLPKAAAVGLVGDEATWLKTWKAAAAIVHAREGF